MTFYFPAHQSPVEKGSMLKGNTLLLMETNTFLLEYSVAPFLEGKQKQFDSCLP